MVLTGRIVCSVGAGERTLGGVCGRRFAPGALAAERSRLLQQAQPALTLTEDDQGLPSQTRPDGANAAGQAMSQRKQASWQLAAFIEGRARQKVRLTAALTAPQSPFFVSFSDAWSARTRKGLHTIGMF